jgi:hypothetical protein
LSPQHHGDVFGIVAHVCSCPAAICVAMTSGEETGADGIVTPVMPCPSSPTC